MSGTRSTCSNDGLPRWPKVVGSTCFSSRASGGNMLTLTVTDVEELKRAMEEPEKYRHLRVRMGGWSAYFVMLSREQQLLHIRRVEHGLA